MNHDHTALEAIERAYPWIAWREPIAITYAEDGSEHWACRICIAQQGLKGRDVPALPTSRNEVERHIAQEHSR